MNTQTIMAARFAARQAADTRCEKCGHRTERHGRWCARCAKAREEERAGQREYRARNREKVAAGKREYYARNREKVAAGKRARWRAAPPRCQTCGRPLQYQGRGRPPVYCAKDKPAQRARVRACDRSSKPPARRAA